MRAISKACSTTRSIEHLRRGGSCNNIRNDAIRFLARDVRERLRRPEGLQALELQFLALGTYVETVRQLAVAPPARRDMLSDREFTKLCAYIEGNLEDKLSCVEPRPRRQSAAARNL